MATSRPFAYNPGPLIPGTEQVGSLSIGSPTSGFTNNPQYWNGPNEDLGYVIAESVSGNTQPTEIPGVFASVGFFRTAGFNDNSFVQLSEYISRKYSTPQTFSSATEASIWLTNNGFWNSYAGPDEILINPIITENDEYIEVGNNEYLMFVDPAGPTPTPSVTPTNTETPTRTPTRTPTPTVTPSNTPYPPGAYQFYRTEGTNPIAPTYNGGIMLIDSGDLVTYNPNDSIEIVFTEIDKSGTSHPEYNDLLTYGGTITLTQGINTYIASGDSGFFNYIVSSFNYYSASFLDVIQLSANPFVSGSPINLTVSVNYPPTPTPTPTVTPTNTPYSPDTYFFFRPEGGVPGALTANGQLEFTTNGASEVTYNPNITDEVVFYLTDKSGLYHPDYLDVLTYGGVLTMTQGSNTVILSADTGQWASYVNYISGSYLEVVQPSPNPFVSGSPINLVLVVNYPPTPTPTPTNTETPTPTPTNTETPTPTPTNTETPTETPTQTPTPSPTDLSSITTFTISGCSSLNVFVADLGPSALAPGDVFYFDFTGGTPSGCYRIVNKIDAVPTDGSTPLYFYANCSLCEAAYVTPTPTVTPTNTPTPSTTPIPVTGFGYNLVALPYNFPSSGNSILNAASPSQTGTTLINELSISQRGFYFNSIDNIEVDRTLHYSQFTGQSVSVTFTQNGDSAIYSGDSQSFKFWSGNTGTPPGVPGTGFVFGTNIGVPPSGVASGVAVLIQSATTTWVTGATVYVNVQSST